MRTPAGQECRHYYADFARGRSVQECRLAKANPASQPWTPPICAQCPVPAILAANASPELELTLTIRSRFLGLGRRVDVHAECRKHRITLTDPAVGCPQCNAERPGFDAFLSALEGTDDPR